MWLICGQFRISTIALEKYKCFGSYPRLFLNETDEMRNLWSNLRNTCRWMKSLPQVHG